MTGDDGKKIKMRRNKEDDENLKKIRNVEVQSWECGEDDLKRSF